MTLYTKSQVAKKTGLPQRMVQFYTEAGVVEPEVESESGRGRFRKYSIKKLRQFAVIAVLYNYGLTLTKVKRIVDSMDDQGVFENEEVAFAFIAEDMKKVEVLFQNDNLVEDVWFSEPLQNGKGAIVLNLRNIFETL